MQLKDIHRKYYVNLPESEFWQVVQADPTYDGVERPQKKGKYTQWLLHAYQKGEISTESLNECNFLLDVFHRYNQLLDVKDIMKYDTLQKLRDALDPYLDDPYADEHETSKAMRIRKIKAGADKVYEDEQWVIFVPHTWEASCYYGKGTRWCTAYDSRDDYFNQYNSQGPLYININRQTKEKWQFHFGTKTFCDAEDNSIDIDDMLGSMSKGVREFYQDKVHSEVTQRTWRTFNEVWAEWLAAGCQGNVNFQYCEQPEGEVFTPTPVPATVTSVYHLFQHCHRLRSVDLSGWNVSAITNFRAMFHMCDHLERVDLSGWKLPEDADLQGMFRYCGVRTIRMLGCDMPTIRAVYAVTEVEGTHNNVHFELTPGTHEYDAYQELMRINVAFRQVLMRRFDSEPDMTQTHDYLLELTELRMHQKRNPLYTNANLGWLKDGLANILRRGRKLLGRELSFSFATHSDGWGIFLFSRPKLDEYLANLTRRYEDAKLALEVADCVRTSWGDIPGLSAELEDLTTMANGILAEGEGTRAMALQHLRAAGFRDRTYVNIPMLSKRMDKWKGNVRSGAQHLRMSKDTLQGIAILTVVSIPVLLVMAAAPFMGAFMVFVCALNSFLEERTKEAAKEILYFSIIIACMTAFSWFVVRPAAVWVITNYIVDRREASHPSYEYDFNSVYEGPYVFPGEDNNQDTTPRVVEDTLSLKVGGKILSIEEVLLAREDTVPFSEHVTSSGMTIGNWCVEAMTDEYRQSYSGEGYDARLLRLLKDIVRNDLKNQDETKVRDIVSVNKVTFMMIMMQHGNSEEVKKLKRQE